jgi:hypothetical protein
MVPYISPAQLSATSTLKPGDASRLRRSLEELQGLMEDDSPTDELFLLLLALHERLSQSFQEQLGLAKEVVQELVEEDA